MTERKTYWIQDIDGVKACVVGAEQRDLWTRIHGWAETTEPVRQERQWVRNEDHGGRGVLNHEASLLHEGLGWHPSDPPPMPGYPEPADRVEHAAEPLPEPLPEPIPENKPAIGGTEKG